MINQYSSLLKFSIDPQLSIHTRKNIENVIAVLKETHSNDNRKSPKETDKFHVHFLAWDTMDTSLERGDFKILIQNKNQEIFKFSDGKDLSMVDAVLEDEFELKHLDYLVGPSLLKFVNSKKEIYTKLGLRNLKRIEITVKKMFKNQRESVFSSDFLLSYAQSLVDLEKDLIQAEDLNKLEKILKHFLKSNIENSRFRIISVKNLCELLHPDEFMILPSYKGEFVGFEMGWEQKEPIQLVKGLFFLNTIINFFLTQHDSVDPFFDESLWEEILDAIPFPIALLSWDGELLQHNSSYAKLGFPPSDCLDLRVREKVVINNIPYNVFRKEVHQLDQPKILFVFFTESFFLKSEGNLTPTGQELGIISSSIAHELNNPIAGIQAAIAVLLLENNLSEESKQTLGEMKSGAQRCKQLIETFLGFSRVNPSNVLPLESPQSTIDICYQQAQNLLRFRSVESGIRFSFDSIKHADFRHKINPSLLTMTFYLILSELMTLYSHQLLVENKNQIEKVIRGEIVESFQEIQIQLHELNISSLSISKLIQNLLKIENFILQVSHYSLRFIHNP
jgi:hypothetical protein